MGNGRIAHQPIKHEGTVTEVEFSEQISLQLLLYKKRGYASNTLTSFAIPLVVTFSVCNQLIFLPNQKAATTLGMILKYNITFAAVKHAIHSLNYRFPSNLE